MIETTNQANDKKVRRYLTKVDPRTHDNGLV